MRVYMKLVDLRDDAGEFRLAQMNFDFVHAFCNLFCEQIHK